MKEWKCKRCGGKEFIENIIGGSQNSTFDKNGDCVNYVDQELDFGDIYCSNCDLTGGSIKEIADYKEV